MSRKPSYIANKALFKKTSPFKGDHYKKSLSKLTAKFKSYNKRDDDNKADNHSFSLLSYQPFTHYFASNLDHSKYLFKSFSFLNKNKAKKKFKIKDKKFNKDSDNDSQLTKHPSISLEENDSASTALQSNRVVKPSFKSKKVVKIFNEERNESNAIATKNTDGLTMESAIAKAELNNKQSQIEVSNKQSSLNNSKSNTKKETGPSTKKSTTSNEKVDKDNGFDLLTGAQDRKKMMVTTESPQDTFTWKASHNGTVEFDLFHESEAGLRVKIAEKNGKVKANQIDLSQGEKISVDVDAGTTYQIDVFNQSRESSFEYDFTLEYGFNFIQNNYAILFSGGYNTANNHDRYDNAMQDIYETLTTVYNVNPKNIYVLYADGSSNAIDLSDGTNSDLSYLDPDTPLFSATNANLQTAAEDLLTRIDSNDNFLFWTFDHGFGTKNQANTFGEEGLNGWNAPDGTEELVNDEFILQQVQPIMESASKSTLVLGQCFAGGVLDEFQTVINDINDTPGKAALGMSAANHFESSFGSSFVDEFNNAFKTYNSAMTTYELAHDNDIYAVARGTYAPNTSTVNNQGVEEHPWVWPGDNDFNDFKIMNTPLYWIDSLVDIKDIPVFDLDKLLLPFWEKYFIDVEFPMEVMPPFPEPIPPCPIPFTYDQLQAAAITKSDSNPMKPTLGFQITEMTKGMQVYTMISPAFFDMTSLMNNANSLFTPDQSFFNIQTNSFQSLRDIIKMNNSAAHSQAESNSVSKAQPTFIAVEKVNADHIIMPNDILLIEPEDGRSREAFSPFSVRAFNGQTVSNEEHDIVINNAARSKTVEFNIKEDEAIHNIAEQIKKQLGADTIESFGQPYRGSFNTNDKNDSSYDYNPTSDYYGSDTFTVQYQDAKGNVGFAQVNIKIESVNDAANAVSDHFNLDAKKKGIYVLDVIDPKTFTSDYDPDHKRSDLKIQLLDKDMKAVDEIKDGSNTVLKVVESQGHQQVVYTPTDGTPADVVFHYQLVDPEGLSSNIAVVDLKIDSDEACRDMKNKIATVLRENQINLDTLMDINQDQTFDTNDTQYLLSLVKTNAIDVSNSQAKPADVETSFDQDIEEALFEVVNTTYTDDGAMYHLLDVNRDGAIDKNNDIMPLHQAAATCNDQNDLIAFLAEELCEAVA